MTRTDDHIPVARTSIKVRMPFAVRDYIHAQAVAHNISAEHLIREAITSYLPDIPPHILTELESMRVHGNTKYHTRYEALEARARQAREKYRQNTALVAAASRLHNPPFTAE